MPLAYDQQPFYLDDQMDLDNSFGELTMCAPVYIKMDAPDQLLLSEEVCHQLEIIKITKMSRRGGEDGSRQWRPECQKLRCPQFEGS